jgi:hypothetical protein
MARVMREAISGYASCSCRIVAAFAHEPHPFPGILGVEPVRKLRQLVMVERAEDRDGRNVFDADHAL